MPPVLKAVIQPAAAVRLIPKSSLTGRMNAPIEYPGR